MTTSNSNRVSVYSLPDLKNASDDALPNFLTSLKFQQSHFLTDVRLGLGYAAVIISAATFYYDYRFGWNESREYTIWAVIVYFLLNSALTGWVWAVEKGTIFEGTKDDVMISISSRVTKHTPLYKLTVRCTDSRKGVVSNSGLSEIEAPFARWFTLDGQFVAKGFQTWLEAEIPMIRNAMASQAKQ